MSLTQNAKDFGGMALGLVLILGLAALGIAILFGAAELSVWALEWAMPVFGSLFLICLLILMPLSIPPATRGFAGNGLYISSYIFGLILWVLSMAFVYIEWGLLPVILGLVVAGVGVIPIAILAAIIEGQWVVLGNIALLIGLTFGLRVFGYWLIEKSAERAILRAAGKANSDYVARARRLDD